MAGSVLFIGCNKKINREGEFYNIKNDTFWNTKDGKPLYSQGGGVFKFTDSQTNTEKYYWYGVHYKEAELYRDDPSGIKTGKCTFVSVTCYSSDDLVNWTFENDVLTVEEVSKVGNPGWVGRMGVVYLSESKKYALLIQHNSSVFIALSDSPTGEFTHHRSITMEEMIGTPNTGDQTVFIDEDSGKSYLVYSKGHGRNRIYLSEIGLKDGMVELLDCIEIYDGEGREGNCLFKYKGKYYMCASNLYGWDASFAYYLSADNIYGPYLPTNQMLVMPGCEEDYAHVSQTEFFYTVRGSKQEMVIFCGDRWSNFAGNGWGYNQWCPLSFDGDIPYFNSLHSWELNEKTGEWRVAGDNNFVKNGSFEADRRVIPSNFKPVQDYLLGWTTTVIEGNEVTVNDSLSPILNFFNSEEDSRIVVGEKSMNISDITDFKRKISQEILTMPFVELPDGYYKLSAMARNSEGFDKLEMYAISDGTFISTDIDKSDNKWRLYEMDNICIMNGKVEIGFISEGKGGAYCHIDEVSLVKVIR